MNFNIIFYIISNHIVSKWAKIDEELIFHQFKAIFFSQTQANPEKKREDNYSFKQSKMKKVILNFRS